MNITVLGDGAFGTALAQTLARNGHNITIWCFNSSIAHSIDEHHINELYLSDIPLKENISATESIEQALIDAAPSWIIEAIPIAYLESVITTTETFLRQSSEKTPWVSATKGITLGKNKRPVVPSMLIESLLGNNLPLIILSGPSFAKQLAEDVPTGLTLASKNQELLQQFSEVISQENLFLDTSQEVLAIQLFGALKNGIALTLGLLEGAGYGANTQALVFTRMIREIVELCGAWDRISETGTNREAAANRNVKSGSPLESVQTFAGIGDLTLTGYSKESRNRTLGYEIGRGTYLTKELPYTEGIHTLRSLHAHLSHTVAPIFASVAAIIFEKQPVESLFKALRT